MTEEKTEVERYLDEKGVSYEVILFPNVVEEHMEELPSELPVARGIIAKTLVLKGNKTGPVIAVLPLDARLDYKKTAKATQNRKIGLPPMEFVLEYTGYVHGANTPFGISLHHPEYPLLIDPAILSLEEVVVSSGVLGRSVKVKVADLIALTAPQIVDLQKIES